MEKHIVWPPVVVVENAGLGKDPAGRFTGLDRAEVETVVKSMVDHMEIRRTVVLYNHAGHLGSCFVLFPSTDAGYADAVALHDAFQSRTRGREHIKIGQKDGDGKLVLYGYLATEADMNRLDRQKKAVKRWKVESYDEVIVEPRNKKMKESQGHRSLVPGLDKDVEQTAAFIEQEEAELEQIREELKQQKELEEAEQRREEEAKARYAERRKELQETFEARRAERLKAHQEKMEQLKAQKLQSDLAELTKASQEKLLLEGNIDRQKEENERIKVEIQALEKAMKQENVLANMKKVHDERLAELKNRQARELFELKQRYVDKQKQLVQEAIAKRGKLDTEMKATEQDGCTKLQADCSICFEDFDQDRKRALYPTCGHARVCLECATNRWKSSKLCPLCNTVQESQPLEYLEIVF